jgi:hypothetical protein
LPTGTVEIAGYGTVTVRGLSRSEVTDIFASEGREREVRFLAAGIVADPPLTEKEVGQWMDSTTFGEVELVSARIAELSGVGEDSAKVATKSDSDRPDTQV